MKVRELLDLLTRCEGCLRAACAAQARSLARPNTPLPERGGQAISTGHWCCCLRLPTCNRQFLRKYTMPSKKPIGQMARPPAGWPGGHKATIAWHRRFLYSRTGGGMALLRCEYHQQYILERSQR
jgi:hypothetical protein